MKQFSKGSLIIFFKPNYYMHNKNNFIDTKINLLGLTISFSLIILLLIIFFGLFLRLYALENPPFWVDESISAIASANILDNGVPAFDSGELYSRAIFFHYSQAVSMFIFGKNDFAARLPSVLFGVLTIILAYLVGKEYSKNTGIISALFTSVLFLEVFFSRQARFYQLFQLMFFATLYFLYKSREDKRYLLPATITFILSVDTQPAGLVLVPFFIVTVFLFRGENWSYYIIPVLTFIVKQFDLFGIAARTSIASGESYFASFAESYINFLQNMWYMMIIAVYGVIRGFFEKRYLTLLLVAPSLIVFFGVVMLDVFAIRYTYFIILPIIIFFSLALSDIWKKLGGNKIILGAIVLLVLIPSNIFYPFSYTMVILPVSNNFGDYSAPIINVKQIPASLLTELKDHGNTLITFFSPSVEWYIKKPDFVIPFSLDGRGNDQITIPDKNVDVYSGAPILEEKPSGKYYVLEEFFASVKLKSSQRIDFNALILDCGTIYANKDIRIYECGQNP